MFTGIVQALGIVLVTADTEAGKRMTISLAELADAPICSGDSICVSGVCLTAVKKVNGNVHFDVVGETLKRSTLGGKKVQDRVNLELSLRGDSYVGGHFVQGHVDGLATVVAVKQDPRDWRITLQAPAGFGAYIVPKGSVALDGVSMTVAETESAAGNSERFSVAVIPTTLENTTLSSLQTGDKVNLETDILSRTVVHYLQHINGNKTAMPGKTPAGITLAKLQELGMA